MVLKSRDYTRGNVLVGRQEGSGNKSWGKTEISANYYVFTDWQEHLGVSPKDA